MWIFELGSIEFLGVKVREEVNKNYGSKGFFIDPVPLTLNSTLFKNYDNKAEVDIFAMDDESKGNPPAKYLYPVIGGGSNKVYETRFNQWLKANNYMKRTQFAYPNRKYKEMIITTGKNNRVIPREPTSFNDMKVWSQKTTALACQNFMLSMRAYGFDTCPMEGFDSSRLKKILKLPKKAQICMTIGAGKRDPSGVYGKQFRFDNDIFIKEI